jgi:L-lactate dehydrogenase complex protein LldG
MAIPTARDKILKKIRQALSNPVPLPFPSSAEASPLYHPPRQALDIIFAEEFTKLQGKFAFCVNETDLQQQVRQLVAEKKWEKIYCIEDQWRAHFGNSTDLPGSDAAITGCEWLVARTGTIVLSAAQPGGRTASVYSPVHICIAYTRQLVYDTTHALEQVAKRFGENIPSLITFASGPSRTADIEKTLVTGVHGPKEVYLFMVDSPNPNIHTGVVK